MTSAGAGNPEDILIDQVFLMNDPQTPLQMVQATLVQAAYDSRIDDLTSVRVRFDSGSETDAYWLGALREDVSREIGAGSGTVSGAEVMVALWEERAIVLGMTYGSVGSDDDDELGEFESEPGFDEEGN